MKPTYAQLALFLQAKTGLAASAGVPLHEQHQQQQQPGPEVTLLPTNASSQIDQLHHEECEYAICYAYQHLHQLRSQSIEMKDAFHDHFQWVIERNLEVSNREHKHLTGLLGSKASADPSTDRFTAASRVFLGRISDLVSETEEIQKLLADDMSVVVNNLTVLCNQEPRPYNKTTPCATKQESHLINTACQQVTAFLDDVKRGEAWADLTSEIRDQRRKFTSTLEIVETALKRKTVPTEWAKKMVAKWIAMMKELEQSCHRKKQQPVLRRLGNSISSGFDCVLWLGARYLQGGLGLEELDQIL